VPRLNPATPLRDAAQELYVQQRAKGVGPTQAADIAGLANFRSVERQVAFKSRLAELSGAAAADPTITLHWLVSELKMTVSGARAANQYKNATEALSQLAELYERHPELRGDAAKPQAPTGAQPTRQQRRSSLRARLSVVSEAAANE
jgi:hypothetical protein